MFAELYLVFLYARYSRNNVASNIAVKEQTKRSLFAPSITVEATKYIYILHRQQ